MHLHLHHDGKSLLLVLTPSLQSISSVAGRYAVLLADFEDSTCYCSLFRLSRLGVTNSHQIEYRKSNHKQNLRITKPGPKLVLLFVCMLTAVDRAAKLLHDN